MAQSTDLDRQAAEDSQTAADSHNAAAEAHRQDANDAAGAA